MFFFNVFFFQKVLLWTIVFVFQWGIGQVPVHWFGLLVWFFPVKTLDVTKRIKWHVGFVFPLLLTRRNVIPRTQLTSIFEGQPSKTRPFPFKTRVIKGFQVYTHTRFLQANIIIAIWFRIWWELSPHWGCSSPWPRQCRCWITHHLYATHWKGEFFEAGGNVRDVLLVVSKCIISHTYNQPIRSFRYLLGVQIPPNLQIF